MRDDESLRWRKGERERGRGKGFFSVVLEVEYWSNLEA